MVSLSDRNSWRNDRWNDETLDQSDEPLAMRHLTSAQKDKLAELLEDYLAAFETGVPPQVDALTRTCPELREPLAACVDGLESLHRMAGGEHAVETVPEDRSRRLGEFELHEEIGRGGMGIVYRATQTSLHRTVAIKLLPLTSVLDPRQLTRFQQEAEAAASLNHPNIVPVHAIGCQRGIHFYAMQFIDGTSMDHVADRSDLLDSEGTRTAEMAQGIWRNLVDQTAQIAEGLHAAHELGVVHRDIKPSNLIIDRDGKPWITDFGLARIQSKDSLTRPGDVIGTMRYMSPEQARGETLLVDGRTDIYSLGATLYEILTGSPAHDGNEAPVILRQVEEDAVTPLRRRRPGLPHDLETVVAKAMASNRDDRYSTAREFAEDLRRVLNGQPTLARPPSLLDRVVRIAARHRAAVATLALFCLFALGAFAISNARLAVQKQISDDNARIAERNETITRDAIDRLGTQMASLLADIPAATAVRHRLLTETLGYYQQLASESESRDKPDRNQQLGLAVLYGKIGSFESELGRNADARRSLEESQRRYQSLCEQFPDDSSIHLQWSVSQNNLAKHLAECGNLEAAAAWFAKAISTQNRLSPESNDAVRTELATTLNNLGRMLSESENGNEAEKVYQRAIALLAHSPAHSPLRSTIQSNLAGLLVRRDPLRAAEIARPSLAAQWKQFESNPDDAKAATQVVLTLNTLASAQAAQSRHREAIDSLRRAVEIGRHLRSRWPEKSDFRRDLAVSLNGLGLSFSAEGRTDRAADAFEQASNHARALQQRHPDDASLQSMLGSTLNNYAFLKQQLGDRLAAQSLYGEAIAHQQIAVDLAPGISRYRVYLSKHQQNLKTLGDDS